MGEFLGEKALTHPSPSLLPLFPHPPDVTSRGGESSILSDSEEEEEDAGFLKRSRLMPFAFFSRPTTSPWDGLEDNVYSRSRGGGKSPHSARRCKCCGGTAKKSSWCIGGKYAAHTGETRECAVFRTLLSANRMKHKPLEKKYLVLLGLKR